MSMGSVTLRLSKSDMDLWQRRNDYQVPRGAPNYEDPCLGLLLVPKADNPHLSNVRTIVENSILHGADCPYKHALSSLHASLLATNEPFVR